MTIKLTEAELHGIREHPERVSGLHLPDGFFDTIEDESECAKYRATLNPKTPFTELYLDGRIKLYLKLRLRVSGVKTHHYLAVFGYWSLADPLHLDVRRAERTALCVEYPNSRDAANCQARVSTDRTKRSDSTVFVGVVELRENPERIVLAPSVVRLNRLDDANDGVWDAREPFDLVFVEVLGLQAAKKLDPVQCPRVAVGQGAGGKYDVVKGGTRIVDAIADEQAELRGRSPIDMDADDILGGLRVGIDAEGVGFQLSERLEGVLDRFQMSLRPAKFQPAATKIPAHDR